MFEVAVFKAERDAGLAELVRSTASVAYASVAQLADPPAVVKLPKRVLAAVRKRVKAGEAGAPDLHYLKTVLASVGWNRNDDVFDRLETWNARATPKDKPFNYEHECDDIIGHITGSWVVDKDFEPLADDTVVDDLPPKFHVCTAAVLYKFWDDESLQERMDDILAEIPEGKWYVSMEALFSGFDYALAAAGKPVKVVSRNDDTAFLTKHLKAYGGNGKYQAYKVGRILRNIVFSGKGLVRKPANPESIIFTDAEAFDAKAAEIFHSAAALGYSPPSRERATANDEERQPMADVNTAAQVDELKAENKALKSEVESLKGSLAKVDAEKVKAREETHKADLAARDQEVVGLKSQVTAAGEKAKAAADEANAWKAKAEKAEADLKAAAAELGTIKAEGKTKERVAALAKALGCDEAKAAEMATKLAGLDDDAFKAHADYMAEKLADYKAATKKGETDAGPAMFETKPGPELATEESVVNGQSTPDLSGKGVRPDGSVDQGGADDPNAKTKGKKPGKQTDKEAPAADGNKKVKTLPEGGKKEDKHKMFAAERDPAAADADPNLLQDAQPNRDASLSTEEVDPGVEKVRASVIDYMAGVFGIDGQVSDEE